MAGDLVKRLKARSTEAAAEIKRLREILASVEKEWQTSSINMGIKSAEYEAELSTLRERLENSHSAWVDSNELRLRVERDFSTLRADHNSCIRTADTLRDIVSKLQEESGTLHAQLQLAADARNVVVPVEPTETMIDAALAATNGRLNIAGSALTVNREKMRIRYRAMIAALKPARTEGV